MKQMTVTEAFRLSKTVEGPAISLYLGTNLTGVDGISRMKANLSRLYKNAELALGKTYDSKTKIRLLEPLKRSLSSLRINKSKGGIGIYHSERFTGFVNIPTTVYDLAVASDSFHIKPVLRCMQLRKSYHLLAFRKKYADLIRVSADETKVIQRIELKLNTERSSIHDEIPRKWFKDGLKLRRQRELREKLLQLNKQLEAYWLGEKLPLALAGSHQLQDLFKTISSHPQIVDHGVIGYIDDLDLYGLTYLSNKVMEQHFSDREFFTIEKFHEARSSGLASTNLEEIALASSRGQIQTLMIADDRHIWGHLDRRNGQVEIFSQQAETVADDLLDDIAELTLQKGGKVTVLPTIQMPDHLPIAATLRWTNPGHLPLIA